MLSSAETCAGYDAVQAIESKIQCLIEKNASSENRLTLSHFEESLEDEAETRLQGSCPTDNTLEFCMFAFSCTHFSTCLLLSEKRKMQPIVK